MRSKFSESHNIPSPSQLKSWRPVSCFECALGDAILPQITDLLFDDCKPLGRDQGMQFGGEFLEFLGQGHAQHFTVSRGRKKLPGGAGSSSLRSASIWR